MDRRDGSFATGSHANLTRGHVSLGRDRVHVIPVITVTLHSSIQYGMSPGMTTVAGHMHSSFVTLVCVA